MTVRFLPAATPRGSPPAATTPALSSSLIELDERHRSLPAVYARHPLVLMGATMACAGLADRWRLAREDSDGVIKAKPIRSPAGQILTVEESWPRPSNTSVCCKLTEESERIDWTRQRSTGSLLR